MTSVPDVKPSAEVAAFLDKLKTSQPATSATLGRGRLIFALDGTASRQPTWDRACVITGEMFAAVATMGGLDLQLVYFGGYDTCKASRWITTAAALQQLMNRVQCAGGETQVERVLSHAIRQAAERKINGLVFIGDAMEESLDRLCRLAGELGSLSVPIFAFQEGFDSVAETAFREMAGLTRGAYLPFDLASIDRLKELLGAIAVYATGGYQALEAYGKQKGGEVLRLTAQLHR